MRIYLNLIPIYFDLGSRRSLGVDSFLRYIRKARQLIHPTHQDMLSALELSRPF